MLRSCTEMPLTATVLSRGLTLQSGGLVSLLPKSEHVFQNAPFVSFARRFRLAWLYYCYCFTKNYQILLAIFIGK